MAAANEILANVAFLRQQSQVNEPKEIDHEAYNKILDETLHTLQAQYNQQEAALSEVCEVPTSSASSHPTATVLTEAIQLRATTKLDLLHISCDGDDNSRMVQTLAATAAYKTLTTSTPNLPPSQSAIPRLLAVQNASDLVQELRTAILAAKEDLIQSRTRLERERTELRDASLITVALETRIENLRIEQSRLSQKSSSQLAKDTIEKRHTLLKVLAKRKTARRQALHSFVDEHLAAMLAAEDQGGPIVGDVLDVTDEIVEAGFTAQGRARTSRKKTSAENDNGDERSQTKIDALFARQKRRRSDANASGGDDDADVDGAHTTVHSGKVGQTAKEMHALLDELLEAGSGVGTSAYVRLEKDSAASRFLVRARVAQFHPRDARQLRLIDFGRDIDD